MYQTNIMINALIYIVIGLGLNIVVGLAGLLDLGYVAFYAVGAYSYALLNHHFGLGFWVALPVGALLGALFGIVSSPCATPVLALILAFVASKGEVVYGTSLLFVYAIGHCALIFLAGTAAGFVESFVQSKGITNITEWGKRIGGSIIVLVGIYLFYTGITF